MTFARPGILLLCCALALNTMAAPEKGDVYPGAIVCGAEASEKERYASQELQRYLYHLTDQWLIIRDDKMDIHGPTYLIGQTSTNRHLAKLAQTGVLAITSDDPGAEGYVLKQTVLEKQDCIAICGGDDQGTLYGVYGLLEKHYGISFTLTGDVYPANKPELSMPNVDEKVSPRQKIRGFLPWTNFPQSATTYSFEDYKYIIDQMTRMRMNFIHIHNYNGEQGHNEMFHNFALDGKLSRVWFPTARTGHAWQGPPWNVNEYLFGARDLFSDYDFGSDAGMHNEGLSNADVFAKGVTLLQRVLKYAHKRGVKIGLGIDIDLIPHEYETKADNPDVIRARVAQIAKDYPDLDYFLAFRSEGINRGVKSPYWRGLFDALYKECKLQIPSMRMAVSGWGLPPEEIAELPDDVIAAPIAPYSAGWDDGSLYGKREYWACPWLERDFDSSVHYYPYKVHLSDTIHSYQKASTNTLGLLCLTWRIGDAVEAKMNYIAQAPWDTDSDLLTSHAVYEKYVRQQYGDAGTSEITAIMNEKEACASLASECQGTPGFAGTSRAADIACAHEQITEVERVLLSTPDAAHKTRLELLRQRLIAVSAYCRLDESFTTATWAMLPGAFEPWAKSFIKRVTDISSLGNIVSTQNRFVQLRYLARVAQLRENMKVQPPSHVEARGTTSGAVITWHNEETSASGFHIYSNQKRITDAPLESNVRSYDVSEDGEFTYSVSALSASGDESTASIGSVCTAGAADQIAPEVFVISPPTSVIAGEPFEIKASIIDNRAYDLIQATLHVRPLDPTKGRGWSSTAMQRRDKAVFSARLTSLISPGLEYYITANDGKNYTHWPLNKASSTMSVIQENVAEVQEPTTPNEVKSVDGAIRWNAPSRAASHFRLYRGAEPGFDPGPHSYLTYVSGTTQSFRDAAPGLDGKPLKGTWHYKLTAVDSDGRESLPSETVSVEYKTPAFDLMKTTKAMDCTESSVADLVPCSEGWYARRMNHMSWISFGKVDCTSISALLARVSSAGHPCTLEFRLENPVMGPLSGKAEISNTGGWQRWVTKVIPFTPRSGMHTLYVRSSGPAGDHACLQWIRLKGTNEFFEAEDADLAGASVYDDPGASAGKAVGFFGAGAGNSIAFHLPDMQGFILTYSSANKQTKQCTLYANGVKVGKLMFPSTGSWHEYKEIKLENLMLKSPLKIQVDEDDIQVNHVDGELYCINVDSLRECKQASPVK